MAVWKNFVLDSGMRSPIQLDRDQYGVDNFLINRKRLQNLGFSLRMNGTRSEAEDNHLHKYETGGFNPGMIIY
jgi:hypothetical protein